MDQQREAEMRQMGYEPLDATDEELVTVWEAHRAGYTGYSVELLRENRARALPLLDQIERERPQS